MPIKKKPPKMKKPVKKKTMKMARRPTGLHFAFNQTRRILSTFNISAALASRTDPSSLQQRAQEVLQAATGSGKVLFDIEKRALHVSQVLEAMNDTLHYLAMSMPGETDQLH